MILLGEFYMHNYLQWIVGNAHGKLCTLKMPSRTYLAESTDQVCSRAVLIDQFHLSLYRLLWQYDYVIY